MPVARVLRRELAVTALLLLGVSVVVFAVLYLAPGDPLNVLLEGQSPRSIAAGAREVLGVPQTWYGRYGAWLAKVLQGNFGNSIRTGLPVLPELAGVVVHTLVLTLASLLVMLVIVVPFSLPAPENGDTAGVNQDTHDAYVLSSMHYVTCG